MVRIGTRCTGCLACVASCPRGAIAVNRDEMSITIDQAKCIQCGRCEYVCPSIVPVSSYQTRRIYSGYADDKRILGKSSSGGIFSVLANHVLNLGGVVCGAAYDNEFQVIHTIVESNDELDRLLGSKYVHSYISPQIYESIRLFLANRLVLFSGTPCQIAGLRNYLGNCEKNLITVEVICHGIVEPYIWNAYLRDYHRKEIRHFEMRSKRTGWAGCKFAFHVEYCDGSRYTRMNKVEPYMIAFANDICLRESCYNCYYRSARVADISLSDFWGVERTSHVQNLLGGTSRIQINTAVGQQIWDSIEKKIISEAIDEKNHNAAIPHERMHRLKPKFERKIKNQGFRSALYGSIISVYVNKLIRRIKR